MQPSGCVRHRSSIAIASCRSSCARSRRCGRALVATPASWPARFRRADSRAVRDLLRSDRSRIDFHRWLQWSLDTQLAHAGRELPLVHDLAVGFAPDGADAWMWQDVVASGARIGAPSDDFNPAGQDWGVPPFDPRRLRAVGYAPLVATLRRMMQAGRGIRI